MIEKKDEWWIEFLGWLIPTSIFVGILWLIGELDIFVIFWHLFLKFLINPLIVVAFLFVTFLWSVKWYILALIAIPLVLGKLKKWENLLEKIAKDKEEK